MDIYCLLDPKECAFGSNVHMNSISLSFVDENPIAGKLGSRCEL